MNNEDLAFISSIVGIQKSLLFYWSLIVFNMGFVLNSFSIILYMRKKLASSPIAAYNIYIALTGNICIVLLYISFLPQSYGINLYAYSDLSCKLNSFLLRIFTQMISWLNVLMSLDTMLSVLAPSKYKSHKTNRLVYCVFAFVFVCLCVVNSANLWFRVMVVQQIYDPLTNTTLNRVDCVSATIIMQTRDMISIIVRILVPFTLMLITNVSLIVGLFRIKISLKQNNSLRRERRLSVSVLAQNLLFIVFMAPQAVAIVYQYLVSYYTIQSNLTNSTRFQVIFNLAILCSSALSTNTICFTFVINLVFNKLFRQECLRLLKFK